MNDLYVGVQFKKANGKIRILIIHIQTEYFAVHPKAHDSNLEFENIKCLHRLQKEILKVTGTTPVHVKYVVEKGSLERGFSEWCCFPISLSFHHCSIHIFHSSTINNS